MRVSVILGGRYRAVSARRALRTLLCQSRMPDEIIIADDGGNAWARAIGPEPLEGVEIKYIAHRPRGGLMRNSSLAVNAAWPACTGDMIFITWNDILVPYHGIEWSLAKQDGNHRTTVIVYALDGQATDALDDPGNHWLGTDFEQFAKLPGWEAWHGACPHPNRSAHGWLHTVMFTSNTRAGWLEFWKTPLSPESQFGLDETGIFAKEQARMPKGGVRRDLRPAGYAVYHQWHLTSPAEDSAMRHIRGGRYA
jgi:hypothetical protein